MFRAVKSTPPNVQVGSCPAAVPASAIKASAFMLAIGNFFPEA